MILICLLKIGGQMQIDEQLNKILRSFNKDMQDAALMFDENGWSSALLDLLHSVRTDALEEGRRLERERITTEIAQKIAWCESEILERGKPITIKIAKQILFELKKQLLIPAKDTL